MSEVQQWARVRAEINCHVRRGAWYPVIRLTSVDAVLEVNQRHLSVPREYVEILPVRPRLWSVVERPRDAVDLPLSWGSRYAVCPHCSARAPLGRPSLRMRCVRCDGVFEIVWSDSY